MSAGKFAKFGRAGFGGRFGGDLRPNLGGNLVARSSFFGLKFSKNPKRMHAGQISNAKFGKGPNAACPGENLSSDKIVARAARPNLGRLNLGANLAARLGKICRADKSVMRTRPLNHGKFSLHKNLNLRQIFSARPSKIYGANKAAVKVAEISNLSRALPAPILRANSEKPFAASASENLSAEFSQNVASVGQILNSREVWFGLYLKSSTEKISSAKNSSDFLSGMNLSSPNPCAGLKTKFCSSLCRYENFSEILETNLSYAVNSPANLPSNLGFSANRGVILRPNSVASRRLNFAQSPSENQNLNAARMPSDFKNAANLTANELNLKASSGAKSNANPTGGGKDKILTSNFADVQNRENGDYAIDVRGLTKKIGKKIITDGIDIRVKTGSVCGFLGPNGSGKTTTIRMLCGLLKPGGGSGRCLGYDFRRDSELIRLKTGYMTQKFGWYDDLSVRENLEFIAKLFALKDQKSAVARILERLDLAPRQNHLAGSLSGGWKQRLALAMCLVHDPELLLLDEPTAGVDPKARREFWDIIHALARKGITVLVSTHYMDEAERCHELIYIAYGKILARGTQADIIAGYDLGVWELGGEAAGEAAGHLASNAAFSVSAFGNCYHIATKDFAALQIAVARLNAGQNKLSLKPVKASLEDVFIHLLETRKDERF